MAKSINQNMISGKVIIGEAQPACTGLIIGLKADNNYSSFIYFDYGQSKVIGIRHTIDGWSIV